MIRTFGLTADGHFIKNFPLHELDELALKWYWIDFDQPVQEEQQLLATFFQFHPLTVEDCLMQLQRPKIDSYEHYQFMILHHIKQTQDGVGELALYIADRFIITFHYEPLPLLEIVQKELQKQTHSQREKLSIQTVYEIMDRVVDQFFPVIYQIEDRLNTIEDAFSPSTVHLSMESVFTVRGDLLKFRRSILPMRDLITRLLKGEPFILEKDFVAYFNDVYDNLFHLNSLIEENRELTADIRDSQLSINSNRINSILMFLTIVSTVFIPLTFLAGVYGMNFENMPELDGRYSYFIILGVMVFLTISMLAWFKYRGWLDLFKS